MNTSQFFDHYYHKAAVNSIMIMDLEGNILDINNAFTSNFGYHNQDLRGKNFSLLFNESDQEKEKPLLELATVTLKGQSQDESYIINKDGEAIWCTGESILVEAEGGVNTLSKMW